MPPEFTLSIRGTRTTSTEFRSEVFDELFEVRETFDLATVRGGVTQYDRRLTDEIVGLVAEGDVEWFGYADDLPDVYGEEVQIFRSGQAGFMVPTTLTSPQSAQRSVIDRVKVKLLKIIKGRAVSNGLAEVTARTLARRIDESNTKKRGLLSVDRTGGLRELPADASFAKALIFIHGTASNFEGGFGNIDPEYWQRIHDQYPGQVYAFNHPTLSASPVRNALDLLEALPAGANFDLITHSRGGLVGDVLARCDSRLEVRGYTEAEIALVSKDYEGEGASQDSSIPQEMRDLAGIAQEKGVFVHRIVRVACPAQGTTLLSDRLDHYLNAILGLLGKAVGGRANPFYSLFKTFLLKVVEEREDPASFPGLYAMVPDLAFIKVNNNPSFELKTELISIAGDADIGGGALQSLKVILSNLYYWQENDLVVNTSSMSEGIARRPSNLVCTIANGKVDHFSYFDEREHMAIVTAILTRGTLPAGAALIAREDLPSARPQLLGQLQPDEIHPRQPSGMRPIAVLLPGIMGSNLYAKDERQWMDLRALHAGGFVKHLSDTSAGVRALSLIKTYYGKFVEKLNKRNYDVRVFPYDWRMSLTEAAKKLRDVLQELNKTEQPVRLVAHSMGGLVVRQLMIDHREAWEVYRDRPGARVVLLGTPWRGSYLITQVLTGHARSVRQLAVLDFYHNEYDLVSCLGRFPGIYELLPLDDASLADPATWKQLRNARNAKKMAAIPQSMLDAFLEYRDNTEKGISAFTDLDWAVLYYVAGNHAETVDGYKLRSSMFRQGDRLRYLTTSEGDGSVTWKRGIPTRLPTKQVFYTNTQHGQLANDPSLFAGIIDVLEKGDTTDVAFSKLPKRRGLRGAPQRVRSAPPTRSVAITDQSAIDNLFGLYPSEEIFSPTGTKIHVEVFNGDLKWARHPVMVGHFAHDGIVSAERTLDNYLDNVLSERLSMGFYPAQVGDQDVVIDYANRPRGAIIVGLGDKEELTGYNLARTVEKGVLKYAVFNRDNQSHPDAARNSHAISTLLIGSNYGELPLRECIQSIVLGVMQANKVIESFDQRGKRLHPIHFIQFVDYYEDRAYECYKTLLDIEEGDSSLPVSLNRQIKFGMGRRKRFLREDSRSWWQTFTTSVQKETVPCDEDGGREYLDFTTYNRGSSISQDNVHSNLELARFLAEELSTEQRWDPSDAKVIFELLVPNRYKDFIRNHRNIAWRMDTGSAAFPWEMFHDPLYDSSPTFTKSGLVRQLISTSANIRPALVREATAMVIANPTFTREDLPPLPGAEAEGREVLKLLQQAKFRTASKIYQDPVEITKALFGQRQKIVHVASHGEFDPERGRVGIAIGGGQLLTPGTLRQFSAIPELVFVNCCFVGQIDPKLEAYRRGRHKLAANIGTQLIEVGVKAVVVAGWAVDDDAAKTFAITFYEAMLDGSYFGEAVLRARSNCYQRHGDVNTWGAYQCYGDPHYRCIEVVAGEAGGGKSTLKQEIILEFDNLISRSMSLEVNGSIHGHIEELHELADTYSNTARELGIDSCDLQRRQARFYMYMADYVRATTAFRRLFEAGTGKYYELDRFAFENIQAKQLVRNHRSGLTDSEEVKLAIGQIIERLTAAGCDHLGPELSATVGSTYKRAALLCNKSLARDYLEKGATCYLKAARQIGINERNSIYFATRFLTLATFTNRGLKAPRINIKDEFGEEPLKYVEKTLLQLDGLPDAYDSVYSQLAEIQLRLCKLVTGSVTGQLSKQQSKHETERLVKLYREQLSECINIREFHSEIEHLEFLLSMCTLFNIPAVALSTYLNSVLEPLRLVLR